MTRVLVVDDSELILAQVGDILVKFGYKVVGTASSGVEAIERAKRLHPDITLLDIVMPGEMDGIEAARQIRSELDIPVILLTGYEDEKSIDRIKEVRADGYVMKPVRPLELKASIEIALGKRESEKRFKDLYREVVEKTSDLIYVVDGKGTIKYGNDQIVRIAGCTKEDAIGRNFATFLTPESLTYAAEVFRRQIKGENVGPFELDIMDSMGNIHVLEMKERLIWENGRVVEVHGIGRDVTERKKVENELRISEEKFRGVFETSLDFMYISSVDGKILDYNPSARDFFGYTDEEIEAMAVIDIYADPNQRQDLIDTLKQKGFIHDYEIKLRKKDGSIIDALATITVRRNGDGTVTGFQGSVKDITQKKQMERQLLQAEKLSGLGTMVSGIAHELNNPLTAIMGNAELLSMNEDVTDRQKKSLDVILQESLRAARIVNGLLMFAREHGPERRLINVNDALMESVNLKRYNLKVNNVDLQLSLSDSLPPTLADSHQLQQVFVNILNNACDALAASKGGTLKIGTEQKGKQLKIVFEDDGPGIPRENIKRLFDPFFTTKEIGKGTGLGLSIAYGVIQEHGGSIEVESEPGRGARFTVEIPVVIGKGMESVEKRISAIESFPGKSILVVDDEAAVCDFLSELLQKEGYLVKAASTAENAILLLDTHPFDAVIADIRMPGMNGMELYGEILKNHPAVSKRVLFVTGDTLSEEVQVFLRVSHTQAISKPFTTGELLATLNRVFEG